MANNLLELPDEKVKEKMWAEIGLNKQNIQEAVEILKNWMQQQPHLPEDYDDRYIERFLLDSKNSIEKAKISIDLYYTIKGLSPDIMSGWDVKDEWIQTIQKGAYIYPGRRITSEGDRACFVGYTDNIESFDFALTLKITIMMLEVRKLEDYWRSNILVVDFKNFTLSHIPKITLPVLKKFQVIIMKAYKYRMKALYMVNVPSYGDIVINTFKSILKKKIADRIHVYRSDLTEFYNQVPKSLLPSDLGGEEKSMREMNELWYKYLDTKREWFLQREKIKSDETKRPGKAADSGEIFGFEGTFRKLDVD